jgi:flagellar assembly protein FliH
MKPAREVVIPLSAPLRDVQTVRCGDRAGVRRQELQTSYEQGRLDGERALGEQLVRQRAEIIELQSGVLAALRQAVPQVVRDCERALVELAVAAAHRLVFGLPVSVELIEAAVREVCAEIEETAECNIQLHPEDLALLERANSPLLLPQGGQDRLRLQPSHQVTRGGCVVQTRFGVIDARRETRAELLRQSIAA